MTTIVLTGNVEQKLASLMFALQSNNLLAFLTTQVEPFLIERASRRFATEGDDVTGVWAPLKPATQAIRASENYGAAHPINVRTGELARFITGSPFKKEVDSTGASLTFPERQPSGKLGKKFKGAQQGEGRAPARPVIGLGATDLGFVMGELETYIRLSV